MTAPVPLRLARARADEEWALSEREDAERCNRSLVLGLCAALIAALGLLAGFAPAAYEAAKNGGLIP